MGTNPCMNKRTICGGNIISRNLPFHIQIYPLNLRQIRTRMNNLQEEFYRNKALYYKKNSFIRLELETNQYLCYHCHSPIVPNKLNVSNRKNIYHLKCAIRINMIPTEETIITKRTDNGQPTVKIERELLFQYQS